MIYHTEKIEPKRKALKGNVKGNKAKEKFNEEDLIDKRKRNRKKTCDAESILRINVKEKANCDFLWKKTNLKILKMKGLKR
jgi:hypothetical protein